MKREALRAGQGGPGVAQTWWGGPVVMERRMEWAFIWGVPNDRLDMAHEGKRITGGPKVWSLSIWLDGDLAL